MTGTFQTVWVAVVDSRPLRDGSVKRPSAIAWETSAGTVPSRVGMTAPAGVARAATQRRVRAAARIVRREGLSTRLRCPAGEVTPASTIGAPTGTVKRNVRTPRRGLGRATDLTIPSRGERRPPPAQGRRGGSGAPSDAPSGAPSDAPSGAPSGAKVSRPPARVLAWVTRVSRPAIRHPHSLAGGPRDRV